MLVDSNSASRDHRSRRHTMVQDSPEDLVSLSHQQQNHFLEDEPQPKSRRFIHSGYLYSAHSRNLLRGALSPATAKEKCLKKLAERRHVVPRKQVQCKRELIPSGGANNRESSTLFKRRAGPRSLRSEE